MLISARNSEKPKKNFRRKTVDSPDEIKNK
jgi:hypothetical protein